jgi:hypothetical protein
MLLYQTTAFFIEKMKSILRLSPFGIQDKTQKPNNLKHLIFTTTGSLCTTPFTVKIDKIYDRFGGHSFWH